MNDWRISSFLLFSFSILALLWITFSLNSSGFKIPLLQQVAGCICLLFVPGIAILRSLRLHKLGSIETPLYAIGISISVVIFIGLLLNTIAPLVGINDPLSAFHLILVFSGIIVALCIASYKRDKDFAEPTQLPIDTLSPRLLSLLLLPFLSIFGAYLVNYYAINWLILFMLIGIGIVVLVVTLRNQADGSTYALAVFVISLSLLLCNALISRYLWGWDIFAEANVVNHVVNGAVWNPAYNVNYTSGIGQGVASYNSVLSTAIFAPILVQIGNISITSLFKIVYPVLYALVPVALYQLFRKQTSDIIAFLSSFFFVTALTFSVDMISLPRQEIAELFLVLILLLIFDKTFRASTRMILLLLFSGTLVVSHYGIADLFMVQLILVFILLFIAESGLLNNMRRKLIGINRASGSMIGGPPASDVRKNSVITAQFVLLFAVMTLTWYSYTAGGLELSTFLRSFGNTVTGVFVSEQGIPTGPPTLLISITNDLATCATVLIFLGVGAAFVQRKRLRFDSGYLAFALTSCGILLLDKFVPVVFAAWNYSRLQHLALIILAPFCIIGIVTLCSVPRLITQTSGGSLAPGRKTYAVASVFLVTSLLVNVGFVAALTQEPAQWAIPSLFQVQFSRFFVNSPDLAGAKWLGSATAGDPVYGDYFSALALLAYSNVPVAKIQQLYPYPYGPPEHTTYYIYVSSGDVAYLKNPDDNSQLISPDGLYSPQFTGTMNKVYDSGCAIYTT